MWVTWRVPYHIRSRNYLPFLSTKLFFVEHVLLLYSFLCFVVVLCFFFVFFLCLVCPMLPVSLDCQFLIAPTVFFVVEFCFVCPCLMSFVSHVASVSRLSILDCPYSFLYCGILFCLSSSYVFCFPCCQCLWIVNSSFCFLPFIIH
jgi:hypothetical protein